MKKALFFLLILVSVTTVFAQNKRVISQPQQMPTVSIFPIDTATVVEQQFILDIEGFRYTLNVKEFLYSSYRNSIICYKESLNAAYYLETRQVSGRSIEQLGSFRIPAGIKNISFLPAGNLKKLVFSYEYQGEVKKIEFF